MEPSLRFERGARIDRYELLYEVGRGGMGSVWAALLRGKHGFQKLVAIKTILPEYASQARFRDMLLNEARITAKIEHPNVVQTLELGELHGALYIVMEWVEGPSLFYLNEKMSERGAAIPAGVALRVIADVCAGLHAAHDMRDENGNRVTVIHSDVSPHNILVSSRGIAKLADFGIAKMLDRAVPTNDVASLRGKMRYIAPERVSREAADQRADIWSLGAVLEELLPKDVPVTCSRVIKRALAPTPAHRFATAQEFGAAIASAMADCNVTTSSADVAAFFEEIFLERAAAHRATLDEPFGVEDTLRIEAATPAARTGRRRLPTYVLAGACALLLVAGAVFAAHGTAVSPRAASVPDATAGRDASVRRSVAVLGFMNLSDDPAAAWISTALSQVLAGELGASETVRVIPEKSIARMKIDLGLDAAATLSPETLRRVHDYLDCDLLVLGSYSTSGENGSMLRIDVRGQSTANGDVRVSVSESGRKDETLALFSRVGRQLEARLGIERRGAGARVNASLPVDPEAARSYAEGLSELLQLDPLAARERLERAIALEPNHALSHAKLAEVFRQLGYGARAAEEAKRAYELAGNLPRQERMLVEGCYREASLEWGKAIEIYRTLFEFFPDNIEYGLGLARAQQKAGKPDEVFSTLATLRELPRPPGADIGIEEVEARAARFVADYPRAEVAASRAVSLCVARSAWHCAAENEVVESDALWAQGMDSEARAHRRQAMEFHLRAGDRLSRASAVLLSAQEASLNEDWETALQLFLEAGQEFRDLGNKYEEANAVGVQAHLLMRRGELARGLPLARRFAALASEMGDRKLRESALVDVAEMLISMGDLEAARAPIQEAVELSHAMSNLEEVEPSLDTHGTLLRCGGDIEGSIRLRKDALERLRGVPNVEFAATWLKAALAELLLDGGNAAEAERAAAEVLATGRLNKHKTLGAHLVRARAQLELGDIAHAKEAMDRANDVNPKWLFMELMLQRRIMDARVRAAAAPASAGQALGDLDVILERARALAIFTVRIEAQLAAGEIEMLSGRAASGRARLRATEKEARSKGYLLAATRAAKLATSPRPR